MEQLDAFHVIARSAFGNLYVCGEKTGKSITIASQINKIFALPKELKTKDKKNFDLSIRSFFSFIESKDFNPLDESGQPLFERAMVALGSLASDEMYGFEPAIVLGGKMLLENLARVKWRCI